MLAYNDVDEESEYSDGRAWVQPLSSEMEQTHDTLGAHSYVVYNGYGTLQGYVAARIVAHLTGKTYRKIEFNATNTYVNCSSGYLISDQETCDVIESIQLSGNPHDQMDAHTFEKSREAA
jgi:hypothetical protein